MAAVSLTPAGVVAFSRAPKVSKRSGQHPNVRRESKASCVTSVVRRATSCSAVESSSITGTQSSRREALASLGFLSAVLLAVPEALAASATIPDQDDIKLCTGECLKQLDSIDMQTTKSGLQYKDIVVGKGPSPRIGFQVAVNYVAMVPNGQVFNSSLEAKRPYIIRIGTGQVIPGLDEGVQTMKVGGLRRLYIPGNMAFPKGLGSAPGRPRVPPSSPVVFDVELLFIPGLDDEEEA
eukprot:jgi/Chlat1/6715/Chrsp50S06423